MQLARSIWHALMRIKDGLALLFLLLFFVLLFALLSSGPNPGKVRDGVLRIDLDGVVAEQPAEVDVRTLLTSTELPTQEYRQRDIIRALDLAVTDNRVKAVAFDLDHFMGGGKVSLGEIADRIDRVKKAGKPVYSFATAYADAGYQLAAHASEIWLDPMGGTLLTGPGGSRPYYKGLLDKLGVDVHVYKVGTYKSAVEPYIRSDQSEPAKQAITAVYDEIWGDWKAGVAKARPQAQIDPLLRDPAGSAESAKGDLATLALSHKLVDRLGDKISFGSYLAGKYGKDRKETTGGFADISMDALLAAHVPDQGGDAIGVLTIAGEIVDGHAGPGTAAGDSIAEQIYTALDEDHLKALVVRVDSPGGSVTASEKIRVAIAAAKAKKLPVIISMANLAASGGYWVSTPADMIFAEPQTITGSIGIFGLVPSAEKALAKFGVTSDGVKTTALSGEPDVMKGISPEFDRFAQSAIENGYREFLSRVAVSRHKTPEQVDAIGQGRVWAGGTAHQIGLVDRFGGLDDALAEAAKRAGLATGDWHPKFLERDGSFAGGLLGGLLPHRSQASAQDIFAMASAQQQMGWARIVHDLRMIRTARGAQIRCTECGALSDMPIAAVPASTGGGRLDVLIGAFAG